MKMIHLASVLGLLLWIYYHSTKQTQQDGRGAISGKRQEYSIEHLGKDTHAHPTSPTRATTTNNAQKKEGGDGGICQWFRNELMIMQKNCTVQLPDPGSTTP